MEDDLPIACLAFPLAAQWVYRVAAAAAESFTDVTTSVSTRWLSIRLELLRQPAF